MTTAPLSRTFHADHDALGATAEDDIAVFVAPFDCTVTEVAYMANGAITGAATNTRRLALVNKGSDGTGTTEIAALQFNAGTNAAEHDEVALTLSATAANLEVAADDVVAFASVDVGSGIADPGGLVRVVVSRS